MIVSLLMLFSRIVETHSKSLIILSSFLLTFAGWWLWQGILSAIYAPRPSAYNVRNAFPNTFGRDLGWWLTLLMVLGVLYMLEMGYKMAKQMTVALGLWKRGRVWRDRVWHPRRGAQASWTDNNSEDWDLGMWQVMEQDKEVKERMQKILEMEEHGIDDAEEDTLERRVSGREGAA